jgi:ribosomal protein S18 acetylase RimI-like enzyme
MSDETSVGASANLITLDRATVQEAEQLTELGRRAFYEAFAAQNTPQNMDHYLKEAFTLEKFTDQLNNPNSQFWVARCAGEMIGYSKFNFGDAQTESVGEKSMEIERIYVIAQYYGKSVGQMLFDKAYEVAIASGCTTLWLGVWEHNARGLKFYRKNGFVEFSSHVFMLGDDPQKDLLLKRQIP